MTKPTEVAQEEVSYKINVVGRHVSVTDAMKQYAIEKIHKMDRISHRVIDVSVTMDVQKLEHRVTIVMAAYNTLVKVSAVSEDMYAAIDKAADRLQGKLRKYKKKIQEHQAKSLHVVDMQVNVFRAPSPVDEINAAIEEENKQKQGDAYDLKPHEIVTKTTRPLKTLTFDEAIMKMELSDDSFRVFRSEEDQKLKVIYLLDDGNGDYGVMELE
jgi:putative sigma-54 modulation protein